MAPTSNARSAYRSNAVTKTTPGRRGPSSAANERLKDEERHLEIVQLRRHVDLELETIGEAHLGDFEPGVAVSHLIFEADVLGVAVPQHISEEIAQLRKRFVRGRRVPMDERGYGLECVEQEVGP